MADISASMVKELRERTQLGMMDCKRALVEAEGDMELAIENLRKSSGLKAAKKAGRIANDGLIGVRVADGAGVMVEINCETDFAARDENFKAFVESVTDRVLEAKNGDIAALLEAGLEAEREALVQKIGENVSIRRAEVFSGDVASYLHNGKIAVMVEMDGGSAELGKDIAMHLAASPQTIVVTPDDMPADVLEKEREIYRAQAAESGKPPEIVEKMIEGKVRKFLSEVSLTEQPFVKDSDTKVGALLKKEQAAVKRFVRYEVGEGIEKAEEDFAAEVAAQLGKDDQS